MNPGFLVPLGRVAWFPFRVRGARRDDERVMQALDALRAKMGRRIADGEALVLLAIAELPKGRRFADLQGRTGLGKSTLASALHRLRERGEVENFVTVARALGRGHRGRVVHYRLTTEGKALVALLIGKG